MQLQPIRVLHIVTQMNRGGLESMLMNYYRHIDRSQVQFDFMVHREERGAYDDEIEALGGRIFRVPKLIPWSRTYLNALDNFFKTHRDYEIVHVHQDCLSSVALKVAKEHSIPVRIAHSHNSSQDKNLKYPIKLWYKKSITKYATTLFACGRSAGQWMFNGASYAVINNAIDTAEYAYDPHKRNTVRDMLGIREDEFVIGHVGRFSKQKNHPFLIKAFAELLKQEPNSVLLLAGGGDGMARAQKQANKLKIANKVRFLGVRSDIPELMQAMDVFAFPSLYEGLPLTLIEAQAAGLPCVISDRIPTECIICKDLVDTFALSAGSRAFAHALLECRNAPRADRHNDIAARKYDISKEAARLQEFYIQIYGHR